MAAAQNTAQNTALCISGFENISLSVKHTFIHCEYEEGTAQKRTSSVPPSFRSSSRSSSPDNSDGEGRGTRGKSLAKAISDASTSSDMSNASEVASEAETVETASDSDTPKGWDYGAVASCDTAYPEEKSRLSVTAKCFVPMVLVPDCAAFRFQPQITAATEAAKAAMAQSGMLVSICAYFVANAITIYVEMRQEHAAFKERLLWRAKQALLTSAEQSESIYVLGYGAKPFQRTPQGFKAVLAGMEDTSLACWAFYTKGSCCQKGCPWQHPTYTAEVEVSITFVSQPIDAANMQQ